MHVRRFTLAVALALLPLPLIAVVYTRVRP